MLLIDIVNEDWIILDDWLDMWDKRKEKKWVSFCFIFEPKYQWDYYRKGMYWWYRVLVYLMWSHSSWRMGTQIREARFKQYSCIVKVQENSSPKTEANLKVECPTQPKQGYIGTIMSLSQTWLVSCTWAVNLGGLCSLKLLTKSWLVPYTWADYSGGPCNLKLLAVLKSFPLAFVMVSDLIPSTSAMSLTAYGFSISLGVELRWAGGRDNVKIQI